MSLKAKWYGDTNTIGHIRKGLSQFSDTVSVSWTMLVSIPVSVSWTMLVSIPSDPRTEMEPVGEYWTINNVQEPSNIK